MASWGLNDKFEEPTMLQEADVSLMSPEACKQIIHILGKHGIEIQAPSDGGICTNPTAGTSSACLFDEGGMLMCQDTGDKSGKSWMLAGVVYGHPCDKDAPSIFVNIMNNLDEIKKHL
ncbi:serine protease 48-like [Gigantopelta aegis]|uniref:serine protease 48-like n=1 Tax=Gigantopelta aegis TaxID=1735272 RepID=UPI001B88D0F1|nr:serine protease 48-like [Gigantopelta aegis]